VNQRIGARPVAAAAVPSVIRAHDQKWDPLLICVAGYVLTAVGRVHQLFAFLEPLHLALVCASLAVALYVLGGWRERRFNHVLRVRTTRYVLGLTLWLALSVPGALWQGGAFEMATDFAKMILMFLVIAATVRGMRDVERLAFIYLLSGGIYAAVVLSRFHVNAQDWRLASLYYYDANDFATFAVMCLPIGVHFMVRPGASWRRLVSAVALGCLAVGVIWAGSRGGFLALLAVAAFLLLRYTAIRARWRFLTTALLAVVFTATATDTYWEKMRTILNPKEDYNITEAEGRLPVWKRGLGYMLDHPVFGVGAGNFPAAEGTLSPLAEAAARGRGVKWSVAHNSFIQVGAELGIPGLLLFVGMLASALRALRAAERVRIPRGPYDHSRVPAQLAQTLMASLIGYMVGGFFLSLAYKDVLFVLIALTVALRKTLTLPPSGAALPPRPWGYRWSF